MTPILYLQNESSFSTNGVGLLSDAVSCVVSEERNGAFELLMEYPITGVHYAEIALRSLILAKSNPLSDAQPFRVYRIDKPIGGVVTVYAEHISYDMTGIPVSPFKASNLALALRGIVSNAATACLFTFWTNKSVSTSFEVPLPASMRSLLGGTQGSLLDVYGGEYEFDRYTVKLWNNRGANRGVTIRYGKNLTDLTQEENIQNTFTGVYPFYSSDTDNVYIELPEKVVTVGTYSYSRIMPLDLSGDFTETPTVAQLRSKAESYITANNIGIPRVSLTVSFVQLEQTEEYKDLALLERVSLCDTVNVEFERLGVSATAKVVRTEYDALLERYNSVEIGDARYTIADTIAGQAEEIKELPYSSALQRAAERATALITGNKGGYVVIRSSTGAPYPDEILIMDTQDINTASKVWRWNASGLGYSSTGYDGTYGTAITIDGAIVANYITAGELNAATVDVINLNATNIVAGYLRSSNYSYTSGTFADAGFNLDLASGQIRTKQFTLTSTGNAYFAGNLSAAGGTFAGNLSAVGGTFKGSLSAVDGTFTNLTGTGRIKLGNANILPEAIQLIRSDINKRLDLTLYQSGRAYVTSNCDINLGGYDSGTYYNTSLFGARIFFTCTDTGYNMSYYLPGTNEAALAPNTAGTCNIGTNTYYFDYVHANTVTQHSLRKDKTDISDLSDEDYDIDKMRPIVYRIKPKKDKPRGELQIGLIAEELEKCCYKACSHDENGELYGIDYSRLAVVAIKELQTLRKRVKELEERTA